MSITAVSTSTILALLIVRPPPARVAFRPRAAPPYCVARTSDGAYFLRACDNQLELLADTLPLANASVFQEQRAAGGSRLAQVASWPVGHANSMIPPARGTEPSDMDDGGLCFPLCDSDHHKHGYLLIYGSAPLGETERRIARRAAATLAVVAALESAGAARNEQPDVDGGGTLAPPPQDTLVEVRMQLAATIHQLKSPLSALRTLAKLLLRRLESSDATNQELARDIMLQSERLGQLMAPIDRLATYSLPDTPTAAAAAAEDDAPPSASAPLLNLNLNLNNLDLGQDVDNLGFAADLRETLESLKQGVGELERDLVSPRVDGPDGSEGADLDWTEISSEMGEIASEIGAKLDELVEGAPPGAPPGPSDPPSPGGAVGAAEASLWDDTSQSRPGPFSESWAEGPIPLLFVSDVLRSIATLAVHLAADSPTRIHFASSIDDELPGVRAATPPLREAITNLIDNALKYASDGSERGGGGSVSERPAASVSCGWDAAHEMVLVEVWSSGQPLDAEELDSIQEWGVRGSAAAATEAPGEGIGLTISNQLIVLLGGELDLEVRRMPQWAWEDMLAASVEEGPAAPDSRPEEKEAEVAEPVEVYVKECGEEGEEVDPRPWGLSARVLLPRAARKSP